MPVFVVAHVCVCLSVLGGCGCVLLVCHVMVFGCCCVCVAFVLIWLMALLCDCADMCWAVL